jgi:metallo-beta-lactamase class B
MLARLLFTFLLLLKLAAPVSAQVNPTWTTNNKPFRIANNLYYVGSEDLAAYLVTTPQGNILINQNLASSVSQIRHNIEVLGFRFADTKILLISQAHFDHCGGTAEVKRLTHAKLAVMDADVSVVEAGGRNDFFFFNDSSAQFAPTKVDRILHDGDLVKLGSTTLTAHLTPGHTKGTTTWTMNVTDAGRTYKVLIFGGASVNPGNNLVNDTRYPNQAVDFAQTFRTLRTLPCDIFLGAHGVYFNLKEKYPRLGATNANPFLDPAGYRSYVEEREQAFHTELSRQKAEQPK